MLPTEKLETNPAELEPPKDDPLHPQFAMGIFGDHLAVAQHLGIINKPENPYKPDWLLMPPKQIALPDRHVYQYTGWFIPDWRNRDLAAEWKRCSKSNIPFPLYQNFNHLEWLENGELYFGAPKLIQKKSEYRFKPQNNYSHDISNNDFGLHIQCYTLPYFGIKLPLILSTDYNPVYSIDPNLNCQSARLYPGWIKYIESLSSPLPPSPQTPLSVAGV